MSLLGNQTNITQNDYFFIRANVSTLKAGNIEANSITCSTLTAQIGNIGVTNTNFISTNYVATENLSSQNLEANNAIFSSMFSLQGLISSFTTNNIVLDGNFIDTGGAGFGAVLLLNGLPIATGSSNLSSIQDWSFFPAVSTLQMGGNSIKDAGNINSQNIFNALNVQSDTFTGLTNVTSPAATITNIRATNISTVNTNTSNLFVQSNVQTNTLSAVGGTFRGISTLALSTGSINGTPVISGSNWSFYPAQTTVQLAGNNINTTGALSVTGSNTMSFTTPNGNLLSNFDISMTGGGVNLTADEGGRVDLFSDINLVAQNGNRGRINLTANGGFGNGVFGEVNLVANGGSLAGVGTGGLITLTANTPVGFSNLTSAIKFSAAGINSYAGATPSIGSLAGYNFIYGQVGVNLCAGLPSVFPNIPGTTYIYGTNGVSLDGINTVEVKATLGFESGNNNYFNAIYPFWTGLATPPDLLIAGRYIVPNLAQVCVNLSNVRNIYFQSNVATTLQDCDTITMTSNGSITTSNISAQSGNIGVLGNTSITGTGLGAITGYSNIGTNNLNTSFINGIPVGAYVNTIVSTFNTASISSATISSINGVGLSNLINSSNFQTASISSLIVSTITRPINSSNFTIQSPETNTDLNIFCRQGQSTVLTLSAVDNYSEIMSKGVLGLNNIIMYADNFGFNAPNIPGGTEFDISGNTQIEYGTLKVGTGSSGPNALLSPSNLTVSTISCSTINGQKLPYPYGSFTANFSQVLGTANISRSTILDTTETNNGIYLVGASTTRVAVSTSGVYRWLASPQFDTTSGGQQTVSFWFQKNGTVVPRSASRYTIQNNGEAFSSVEIILPMNAQDYIETCFTSTDSNMNLAYYPASGVIPAVPSIILNGQKVAES